jgi:hypothetical protein
MEAEPAAMAIDGHVPCVFVEDGRASSKLEDVGPFTEIHGGEWFCARAGDGRLWCGHERRRDALVEHPVAAPRSVSVTRDGFCATDDEGATCVLRVPSGVGSLPVPSATCALRLPGARLVAIHGYDARLTRGWSHNYYVCATDAHGHTRCVAEVFEANPLKAYGRAVATPTELAGLSNVTALALPASCAMDAAGTISCWSPPSPVAWSVPQHAPPPEPEILEPRPWAPKAAPLTGLPTVVELQSGMTHACALDRQGAVWCWGQNEVRQLGFKMRLPPPTYEEAPARVPQPPTRVLGLPHPTADLGVGALHTCAAPTTGAVFCWGYNAEGQLGSPRNDCHAAGHAPGLEARCAGPGPVPRLRDHAALSAQGNRAAYLTSDGRVGWIEP